MHDEPNTELNDKQLPGGETEKPKREERRHRILSITGWTRIIAAIPAIGLFIASLAISINALVAICTTTLYYASDMLVNSVAEGADGHSLLPLAIEYVEYTDMFLLAIALYIMALGLVRLFISDRVPSPKWLQINTFDDLKELLISVICVMMGVFFLGQVLQGQTGIDLLKLAGGIALVIAALTLFVRNVIGKQK